MHILDVARWLLLALALHQLVFAVRDLRPALRAEGAERTDRWLDFADHLLGVPSCAALAFGWFDLFLYLMVAAAPVAIWRLIRNIRARRRQPATPV
ncbi:hypothetical protein AB0F11_18915 [Streptomyces sp. NPDC032472]|uniref:hypothetical protein n=1 Tax=Streptomyces sp. NPDC032472 TaxID=3155018 RepID=UPI003408205B